MTLTHHHPHEEPLWKAQMTETRHCSRCGGLLELQLVAALGREHKVCQECSRICFFNPKVAAGALILIDGKIVLVQRAIQPGYGLWTFPGGFVDLGESAQEAAQRETLEEVGLEVKIGAPAGVYTSSGRDTIVLVFWATVTGGTLQAAHECLDVKLFAPDEIPWDVLAFPSTRALMHDHFPHRPIS